jgi:ABC-type sugar transport system permease subunit
MAEMSTPTPATPRKWSSSRLSETQFALLLTLPLLVVLLAVVVYPLGYSIWMSLQRIDLIFNTTESVGLQNYRDALNSNQVHHAFRITIYYTILVTIFSLAASIGGALLLNEKFRGRPVLMTIVILPWAVSLYATSIVWRYLYSAEWGMFNAILLKLHIIDRPFNFLSERWAVPGVALAHAWQITPLGIYFILATLQVIPEDQYKMAKVDRLGPLGRFRFVVFPYIKTSILIIMVLITVEAARAFDTVFFLTNGGPGDVSTTLSWAVYLETFQKRQYGYGAAIGWLLVIFTMIITTVYFLLLFYRRKQQISEDGQLLAEGGFSKRVKAFLMAVGAAALLVLGYAAINYVDMVLIIAGFILIIAAVAMVAAFLIRSGDRPRKALIYFAALVLLIWTLVPIYWMLNMSLMFKTELLTLPTHLFPHEPTLSNFIRIFGGESSGPTGEPLLPIGQAPALKQGFINSTIVALVVTALTMVVALPVSYALGRMNFKGKTPLLFTILATRSYPPISIVIPFFYLYTKTGLQGSLRGLIIIYFTLTIPMIVWVLTSFFSSLPRTVEAAARVDGNTRIRTFVKVIMPLSWPGIAVATAISFMVCWNEFAFAQFLTAGSKAQTYPPVLPSMLFQISMPTELAAASIVGIIPPAVIAYLFQRRIRSVNLVDPL